MPRARPRSPNTRTDRRAGQRGAAKVEKESSYLECPFGETSRLSSDRGQMQLIRRNQGRGAGSGLHRQGPPPEVCRHRRLKSHDTVRHFKFIRKCLMVRRSGFLSVLFFSFIIYILKYRSPDHENKEILSLLMTT